MVTHESSSDPFWAFKNQEWKLVFLHWACATKFSFVQVKPYATMGRAYLGRVQFPYRALSPKVGMRKSMIHKRIKKKLKACSLKTDFKNSLATNHVRLNFPTNHQKFTYLPAFVVGHWDTEYGHVAIPCERGGQHVANLAKVEKWGQKKTLVREQWKEKGSGRVPPAFTQF
jgi:hypothetical protein